MKTIKRLLQSVNENSPKIIAVINKENGRLIIESDKVVAIGKPGDYSYQIEFDSEQANNLCQLLKEHHSVLFQ